MDARTHSPSGHKFLCPMLRWGSAVQRIIATIPDWNEQTTLCSVFLDGETIEIGNAFVRKLLRHTCAVFGGFKAFGFHPLEIGNKSLQPGAAVSLFLMDHSPAKIMILGRWSSDAFLVCVRPQVLEWTNNMSCDMIHLVSFFDAPHRDLVASEKKSPLFATHALHNLHFVPTDDVHLRNHQKAQTPCNLREGSGLSQLFVCKHCDRSACLHLPSWVPCYLPRPNVD
jgi:hypothetical protein